MSPDCEVYKNEEGKIAVLVSPGYGAGWSTWDHTDLAYDKRIVEYILENGVPKISEEQYNHVFENFIHSLGYENTYINGAYNLEIEWVEPGSYVRITEYDGSECLEVLDVERSYILLN